MDEFVLPIEAAKFRSTNATWNNLMLNDPWSVGYVTTLIELVPFAKKEDWEQYYFESGQQREGLILNLEKQTQDIIQNEQLVRTHKQYVDSLPFVLKNLNTQYGRTQDRLYRKGEILFNSVKENGYGLSIDECFQCVKFRVIGETWNGVIVRERNTIVTLQQQFPNYEFIKVSGETDHKFAVDYEVYKNGVLASAIQIKPQSYTWNAPYIIKAKAANRQKNLSYFAAFKVNVFDVISDSRGNIKNPEILRNL